MKRVFRNGRTSFKMSIRYFASKNLKIFLKKIASRLFLPNSNPGGGPWNLPKIRSAIGLQIYVAVVKIVDHLPHFNISVAFDLLLK